MFPTNSEQEIIDLMQEEASEVIQIVSKIRRFGWNSVYPPGGDDNFTILLKELSDMLALKHILQKELLIPESVFQEYVAKKLEKLKKYSTIQHELLEP